MLFPGVDPKERRAQLRIVLAHLRRKLGSGVVANIYSESGTDLTLVEAVGLDGFELLSGEAITLDRLAAYSKPVLIGCNSRFADKCRGMVKNALEASLPSALATCPTASELWAVAPILGQLRALYPLSATICAYRVAVLTRLHLFEEATQEIAEFETEWIEAYGLSDKPDVEKIIARIQMPAEAFQ